MEHELRLALITVADRYQESAHALAESTICNRYLRNEPFLARVRDGKSGFNVRVYDRLMAWYAANWPSDVKWPAGISRPEPTAAPSVAVNSEGAAAVSVRPTVSPASEGRA